MSDQEPQHTPENAQVEFRPVAGHPDDDECTHRSDGTDATYCGQPRAWHEHHPRCYQNTGVPDDLPGDLCDCRVLRMIEQVCTCTDPAVACPACLARRDRHGWPTDWQERMQEDDGGWHCAHEWLDRPESDTRECVICGTEVAG
ncbi:MAG: hypothetical protein EPO65_00430 [Dehalococcoidia bacterium]|nr:MAG: hypothetical protein EPO65_00430 [Dehalococcoidia bacterium]